LSLPHWHSPDHLIYNLSAQMHLHLKVSWGEEFFVDHAPTTIAISGALQIVLSLAKQVDFGLVTFYKILFESKPRCLDELSWYGPKIRFKQEHWTVIIFNGDCEFSRIVLIWAEKVKNNPWVVKSDRGCFLSW
jgi:hypothetical protein